MAALAMSSSLYSLMQDKAYSSCLLFRGLNELSNGACSPDMALSLILPTGDRTALHFCCCLHAEVPGEDPCKFPGGLGGPPQQVMTLAGSHSYTLLEV